MTLDELKAKHPDIILGEASWDDITKNASGAAYFYVSLHNSTKPKGQRPVLWAGHVLTAGISRDVSGDQLIMIRATASGSPRIGACYAKNLGPDGSAALYKAKPIPDGNPRARTPWNKW